MSLENEEFVFTRATTVHEALALVGIDGDATDPGSTAGTLAALWGGDATTKVETLGELPATSFTEELRNWRIGQNPAPLVLRGKAERVGRLARAIFNPTPSTSTTLVATAAISDAEGRKIKLSMVVAQWNDTEIEVEVHKMAMYFARWSVIFGKLDRPEPCETPAPEQMSALEYLIKTGQVPYVDFSIWGPFFTRIMKRLKLVGKTLTEDGTLTTMEIFGPPTFEHWKSSYRVFVAAALMADLYDLGMMVKYRDQMEEWVRYYGHDCWLLIYQADVRFRQEMLERQSLFVQMEADREGRELTVKQKWQEAWRAAFADQSFWTRELKDPAMAVCLKLRKLEEVVHNDARAASHTDEHLPSSTFEHSWDPSSSHGVPAPPRPAGKVKKIGKRGQGLESSGSGFLTNRNGVKLCDAFNLGQCSGNGQCSWSLGAHQCHRCLRSDHGAWETHKCPKAQANQGSGKGAGKDGKNQGGKNKGGKGGKNKGGKGWGK